MMRTDNPFDKHLDAWRREIPARVRDAAVLVTDTLDLIWASAQACLRTTRLQNSPLPFTTVSNYDRIEKHIADGKIDSSELHD